MKSLITGSNGFIASYLIEELQKRNDQIYGLALEKSPSGALQTFHIDITNQNEIESVLNKIKPNRIFHLAAQSNIPRSFSNPQETIQVNINGSLTLFEAVRRVVPSAVVISVGSSAEYGHTARERAQVGEDDPLQPTSPYGASKAAQGMLALIYETGYKLNIIHVRPFAIIGPRKTADALSDFCQLLIKLPLSSDTFEVGNLEAERDFVDVRDAVRALVDLSESGKPGQIYNVCNGQAYKMSQLLEKLISISGINTRPVTSAEKFRPIDDARIVGDPRKLQDIGFKPEFSLDQTLTDTWNYWKNQST